MELSNRQKKIGALLQTDLAQVIQHILRDSGKSHILTTVTKVVVTVDLSIAKVYVSVFPAKEAETLLKELNTFKAPIKHRVAQLIKNQLRKMPDLNFYWDNSLEYIEQIDSALKGSENPIKSPELLARRKKK